MSSSVPRSEMAVKAFGSSTTSSSTFSSRFSSTPRTEFSDAARSAFHSKSSERTDARSFPSAFQSKTDLPATATATASAPRAEFSEAASQAFGGGRGGRRANYSDQDFSAFGGTGSHSHSHSNSAFGRKERRPLVGSTLKPVPLTAAELLIAEAKSKTTWGNSALATTTTTVKDVLKNEEVFPTLGAALSKSSKKVANTIVHAVASVPTLATTTATAATTATTATTESHRPGPPTMAEKAKIWSAKHDEQRAREAHYQEELARQRSIDSRQIQLLRSIHSVSYASTSRRPENVENVEKTEDPEEYGDHEEPEDQEEDADYDGEDYN